jgi:hypothetical protein
MHACALVMVVGCYNPSVQPGSPCPDGFCPGGLVCTPSGTCELTDGVPDAAVDVADVGGNDAPPAGLCAIPQFADTFSDATVDPFWTVNQGTGLTVSETGGVLRAAWAGAAADQTARYEKATPLDFRDGCALFEIVTLPTGSSRFAFARVGVTDQNVRFYVGEIGANHMVFAERRKGSLSSGLGNVIFDATKHRFLRIRNMGTTFFLETSGTASGPFVLLGSTNDTNITPAATTVSMGGGTGTAPAAGNTTADWSSFALFGP